MKIVQFLLFISIALSIYFSVNYFIYRHTLTLFKDCLYTRRLFTFLFIFIASSYFLYRFIDRIHPTCLVKCLGQIGSIWLGIMAYAFIFLLLYDVLFLILKYSFPDFFNTLLSIKPIKWYIALIIVSITGITVLLGFINNQRPIIREIAIQSTKPISHPYKIVYVSDLHIGDLFFPQSIPKLVSIINQSNVDIVLFGGDIFTEDVAHLAYHDSGEHLKNIKSNYGVYTVLGNHEYIGGLASAKNHFNSYQIKILEDSSVVINKEIVIIGRDDLSGERFQNKKRKELPSLLSPLNDSLFTILIDHQPQSFQEGKKLPIDLFLSGHTHHGQMYPFSYITKKIFDNSWGLQTYQGKYYYVSSGYGFWGPPVRTGSRSEIIIFTIDN